MALSGHLIPACETSFILHPPRPLRGAIMRRREAGRIGGGAGEQALTSVAGARQFRAFAGAAPAGVLTHSTHSGCVGAPPGDTTVPCQELADGSAKARCGKRGPPP